MKQKLKIFLIGCTAWFAFQPAHAFEANVQVAPICTQNCAEINVTQYGILPNKSQDETPALNQLLTRFNHNVVLYFPAGKYHFATSIQGDHLSNVRFNGAPGAIWEKSEDFQGEYLLISRFSQGVAFSGLTLRGLTQDRNKYYWGESGLYLGSSNGILIEHDHFYDFGDAAIRITSSTAGPKGVSSGNSVIRDNYFENVSQVTTTSNKNGYGGSVGCLVDHNEFRNLKGSVKFATRTPGAEQIIVSNNKIVGTPSIPTSIGIEVVGYSNVFLENNQISDCGGFGMNIYSNPAKDIQGFDWGNYLIRGNRIDRCLRGIRVSAQPFSDGYKPNVTNINILKNTIHVRVGKPIQIPNAAIPGLAIEGNLL